jgi:hypothetical protein
MQKEETRFTLRIDANLFENIKQQAEKHKRSAAKEIEFILEKYLAQSQEYKDNQQE